MTMKTGKMGQVTENPNVKCYTFKMMSLFCNPLLSQSSLSFLPQTPFWEG